MGFSPTHLVQKNAEVVKQIGCSSCSPIFGVNISHIFESFHHLVFYMSFFLGGFSPSSPLRGRFCDAGLGGWGSVVPSLKLNVAIADEKIGRNCPPKHRKVHKKLQSSIFRGESKLDWLVDEVPRYTKTHKNRKETTVLGSEIRLAS